MKVKKIVFIAALLLILWGVFYCLPYKNTVELYINGEKFILSSTDENREFDLKTLSSTRDSYVKVTTNGKTNVKVNGKRVFKYIKNNIGKIAINEDSKIEIEIKFGKNKKTTKYVINTLPSTFLEYDTKNNGDNYDGIYYMSTYSTADQTSYIFNLNSNGEVLYYKSVEGFCSQFRHEISKSGKDRFVYTAQDLSDDKTVDMNNIYGKFVVMDENYKVIDEARYITEREGEKTYTIFEYIDDYHYLMTSSYKSYVDDIEGFDKVMLTQNNIEEVENGKVIFKWESEEHKELYGYTDTSTFTNEGTNDYLHINKIIIDPVDGNIIASFRNISTILKIDRKTGDIIWSLGGKKDDFGLTLDEMFNYQHSLSFTSDHSLMIFDNGDNRPLLGIKNESKVVKIKLDEKNKKVENYKAYKLNGVYSMAMGSVQVIDEENDVFLVTYGTGIFNNGPVALIDFKNNKNLFEFNLHSNKMMFSSEKE